MQNFFNFNSTMFEDYSFFDLDVYQSFIPISVASLSLLEQMSSQGKPQLYPVYPVKDAIYMMSLITVVEISMENLNYIYKHKELFLSDLKISKKLSMNIINRSFNDISATFLQFSIGILANKISKASFGNNIHACLISSLFVIAVSNNIVTKLYKGYFLLTLAMNIEKAANEIFIWLHPNKKTVDRSFNSPYLGETT